jgi:hypothetical protein
MIALFLIGSPLLIFCTWIFFKKIPQNVNKSYIIIYNFSAFFITLFISTYFSYNSYIKIINTVDRGWAPITTTISFSFIFIVSITLAFIVRNFLLFKNKK